MRNEGECGNEPWVVSYRGKQGVQFPFNAFFPSDTDGALTGMILKVVELLLDGISVDGQQVFLFLKGKRRKKVSDFQVLVCFVCVPDIIVVV